MKSASVGDVEEIILELDFACDATLLLSLCLSVSGSGTGLEDFYKGSLSH